MRYYPAVIHDHEKGGYWATFADEEKLTGVTQGEDLAELDEMLEDLLICNVKDYFDEDKYFPEPTEPKAGERLVAMSSQLEAKVLLNNERVKQGLTKKALGELAGLSAVEIGRILNPRYGSKIDAIEKVLIALGKPLKLALD